MPEAQGNTHQARILRIALGGRGGSGAPRGPLGLLVQMLLFVLLVVLVMAALVVGLVLMLPLLIIAAAMKVVASIGRSLSGSAGSTTPAADRVSAPDHMDRAGRRNVRVIASRDEAGPEG